MNLPWPQRLILMGAQRQSAFDWAFCFTVEWQEAGWDPNGDTTNTPGDRGGLTQWGISKIYWPALDVGNLTRQQAMDFYRVNVWDAIKGDDLAAVDPRLALATFDHAVHRGTGSAAKALQGALGVRQDGEIGPLTLAALKNFSAIRRKIVVCGGAWTLPLDCAGWRSLALNCLAARALAVEADLLKNPNQDQFAEGWRARLACVAEQIGVA